MMSTDCNYTLAGFFMQLTSNRNFRLAGRIPCSILLSTGEANAWPVLAHIALRRSWPADRSGEKNNWFLIEPLSLISAHCGGFMDGFGSYYTIGITLGNDRFHGSVLDLFLLAHELRRIHNHWNSNSNTSWIVSVWMEHFYISLTTLSITLSQVDGIGNGICRTGYSASRSETSALMNQAYTFVICFHQFLLAVCARFYSIRQFELTIAWVLFFLLLIIAIRTQLDTVNDERSGVIAELTTMAMTADVTRFHFSVQQRALALTYFSLCIHHQGWWQRKAWSQILHYSKREYTNLCVFNCFRLWLLKQTITQKQLSFIADFPKVCG